MKWIDPNKRLPAPDKDAPSCSVSVLVKTEMDFACGYVQYDTGEWVQDTCGCEIESVLGWCYIPAIEFETVSIKPIIDADVPTGYMQP